MVRCGVQERQCRLVRAHRCSRCGGGQMSRGRSAARSEAVVVKFRLVSPSGIRIEPYRNGLGAFDSRQADGASRIPCRGRLSEVVAFLKGEARPFHLSILANIPQSDVQGDRRIEKVLSDRCIPHLHDNVTPIRRCRIEDNLRAQVSRGVLGYERHWEWNITQHERR